MLTEQALRTEQQLKGRAYTDRYCDIEPSHRTIYFTERSRIFYQNVQKKKWKKNVAMTWKLNMTEKKEWKLIVREA